MAVLLEFSMFPTDVGESKSKYVGKILQMIDESGVEYKLTPMSTVIQTKSLHEALQIVQKSYELLENECNRIYSCIKIDIRKNKDDAINSKIQSLNKVVGKTLKT